MIINIYSDNAINQYNKDVGRIYNEINGEAICSLTDIISGTVTREINTEDTLEFEYSILSPNSNEIRLNRIVEVKSDPYRQTQYFRIQSIDKEIDGIISVYALHICYDLSGRIILTWPDFNVDTIKMQNSINDRIIDSCYEDELYWPDGTSRYLRLIKCGIFYYNLAGLELESDMREIFGPDVSEPVTLRDVILSSDYSALNSFGGEIEFDRYNIIHRNRIGTDRGYRIEYATNMISYNYSESTDNVYSDILPYWIGDIDDGTTTYKSYIQTLYDANSDKIENVKFFNYDFNLCKYDVTDKTGIFIAKNLIPIYYTDSNGNKKRYNFTKILPVNITDIYDAFYMPSEKLSKPPSRVDIAKCGIIYILNNNIGNYSTTLSVDFTDLSNVSEYSDYKKLMKLEIGDTVTIVNKETNLLSTAECIKTVYNIITDSYESMELGDIKIGFEKIISKNLKKNNRIFYNKKIK